MAKLSIRKLPEDLDQAIRRETHKRNTTKTRVVIEALRAGLHISPPSSPIRKNIRAFFGKMSKQDYKRFQKITKDFSDIDEDMWS